MRGEAPRDGSAFTDAPPDETESAETQPGETLATHSMAAHSATAETLPADTLPADTQPGDTQPGDTQPLPVIATWTDPAAASGPGQVPISRRTGEPVRVWPIWVAATASYLGIAVIGVATLLIYYAAISRFAEASWLMGQWPTAPGSGLRVLLAVAVTAVTLLISSVMAITGYYAYAGYRWTRWSSLVAVGVSLLSLLLTPLAWSCIGLAALTAGALWLPLTGRYFATWQAHRSPAESFAPGFHDVYYGPLPRYS